MNGLRQRERARAALQLGRFEEASREAGLAIAADPDDFQGYYLLGHALHALKRTDEALAAVDSGLGKNPGWQPLFILEAQILRERGNPLGALQAAEEAVRLEPDDADGHCEVALAEKSLGHPQKAQEALGRAIELAPDEPRVHFLYGDFFLDQGKDALAEKAYRAALALEPNDAAALNNLGCALLRQKRPTEAALAFKSALMLDPSLTVAKENTHNAMRGLVGSASVFGALLIVAKVVGTKALWVFAIGARVLMHPSALLIIPGLLVAGVVTVILVRRFRIARLRKRDPQLLHIFERLEADHKAGRLK